MPSGPGAILLEPQPQRQLHVARVVLLSQSHHACRSPVQTGVRTAELRRIGGVERFRAELEVPGLVQLEGLEHREVRVRYLRWTDSREHAAQRPHRVRILLDRKSTRLNSSHL